MNGKLNNIIRKQTVHVQYNGQADGFALQKEVGDWCTNELMPLVEQQLEVLCRPGIHVALDKIDIGAIVQEVNWKEQAQQQLLKAMNEKLYTMGVLSSAETFTGNTALYGKPWTAGVDNSKGIASDQAERGHQQEVATKDTNSFVIHPASSGEEKEKVAFGKKADELIIFFFTHGYLPWWSGTITTIGEFPQFFKRWVATHKNQARVQNIVQQLREAPAEPLIERMLNHLPGTLFFRFAKTCFPAAATELDNMATFLSHLLDGDVNKSKSQQLVQPVYRYWLSSSFQNGVPPSITVTLEILYNSIKANHPEIIRAAKEEVERVASANKSDTTVAWRQLVLQKEGVAQKQSGEIPKHSKEKGAGGHLPATGALDVKAKVADNPQFPKIGEMQEKVRQNLQEAAKVNTQGEKRPETKK